MSQFKRFKSYLPVLLSSYWTILILRGVEITALIYSFGWNTKWIGFELLGLLYDFAVVSALLLIYLPFYYLINKLSKVAAKTITIILLFLFTVAHFLILSYFIHQLIPLDVFLYQHPFEEIYFTITTSNVKVVPVLIAIGIVGLIPCLIYWRYFKKSALKCTAKTGFSILIIGAFIAGFILLIPQNKVNKFTQNKSSYFYFNSLQFLFKDKNDFPPLTSENIAFFQNQYPHKKFTSQQYPLLHERSKNDGLYEKMEVFDTLPNVVLIIVEGLSDEYIHNFHGIDLMPFVNSLKDSSLYWESCFTLGERSFAAVPSLLGGLPYGDLGFTLLENYPHHHTLVNLLKSRKYHTGFYYGQGAWFHNKRSFFKYNNIDWIVDKENFDTSYEKIIVGENDYFWGYNDKDLFDQYFKTLDSLPKKNYFNTFFTGTSHPPYRVTNEQHYSQMLKEYTTNENAHFISAFGTYLKTIRFVDDALLSFFESYKHRADYKNTVFIITGDHPMSELPRKNELTKYHVPLLIYSPQLKESKSYSHTVSHLDVSTTLLTFLEHYTDDFPAESASLGYSLFDNDSSTTRRYAFMDGNRGMYEYYADGYFLRKEELYKVGKNLSITLIDDEQKKKQLKSALNNFKTVNYRTSFNHRIMSNEFYAEGLNAEIFYSQTDSTLTETKEEFINFVPSTKVSTSSFRAEIVFDLKQELKGECSIVFQVKNKKDSVLSWSNIDLEEAKSYQVYFNYKDFLSSEYPVYFSAYIWNQEREKVVCGNLRSLVREIKK